MQKKYFILLRKLAQFLLILFLLQNYHYGDISLWGYPANDLLFKKNLINNQYQILDQLALDINKKYGNLSISIGIAEIINDSFFPNLYNSIALVEGGEWKIIEIL